MHCLLDIHFLSNFGFWMILKVTIKIINALFRVATKSKSWSKMMSPRVKQSGSNSEYWPWRPFQQKVCTVLHIYSALDTSISTTYHLNCPWEYFRSPERLPVELWHRYFMTRSVSRHFLTNGAQMTSLGEQKFNNRYSPAIMLVGHLSECRNFKEKNVFLIWSITNQFSSLRFFKFWTAILTAGWSHYMVRLNHH